jgi:hypothetical protein
MVNNTPPGKPPFFLGGTAINAPDEKYSAIPLQVTDNYSKLFIKRHHPNG